MDREQHTPTSGMTSLHVKELKNQVIGNEIKKQAVLDSGMLPSLSKALLCDDVQLLLDLIPLLTSLAFNRRPVCGALIQKYGMHRRLASLLATMSTNDKLVVCVLRSLKSLFRSRRTAAELAKALVEGGCVPVLVRLLSSEQTIGDLAACVLASCCSVAATACCTAEPNLISSLLNVLRPDPHRDTSTPSAQPSPRCQSQSLIALTALVDGQKRLILVVFVGLLRLC